MKVKVNKGLTINMGNFESARVDIGFEADVKEDEEIGIAFLNANIEVDAELAQQVKKIKETKKLTNL